MPTLRVTQDLLWTLITAPEGVGAALAGAPGEPLARALEQTVRGDDRLSAVERLDIYANMYFYRLLDVLKDDYPAVLAVAGDAAFHNLVTDYLLVHFPSHPSLRFAGEHLPAFVATHALAARYPFLADLACLEWAMVEAFDAADAAILSAADLTPVPAEQWAALRFLPHPSLRTVHSQWRVDRIRRRVDAEQEPGAADGEAVTIAVWRRGLRVVYRALDAVEASALGRLVNGATFGEACSNVAETMDEADAAERLASGLAGWVEEGLFRSADLKPPS
jgi:hypothetical protein